MSGQRKHEKNTKNAFFFQVATYFAGMLDDLPEDLLIYITSLVDDASALSFAFTSKFHSSLLQDKVH